MAEQSLSTKKRSQQWLNNAVDASNFRKPVFRDGCINEVRYNESEIDYTYELIQRAYANFTAQQAVENQTAYENQTARRLSEYLEYGSENFIYEDGSSGRRVDALGVPVQFSNPIELEYEISQPFFEEALDELRSNDDIANDEFHFIRTVPMTSLPILDEVGTLMNFIVFESDFTYLLPSAEFSVQSYADCLSYLFDRPKVVELDHGWKKVRANYLHIHGFLGPFGDPRGHTHQRLELLQPYVPFCVQNVRTRTIKYVSCNLLSTVCSQTTTRPTPMHKTLLLCSHRRDGDNQKRIQCVS